MGKNRAFVRYSKLGKLVPGSLIITNGSYPSKPSTWKEIPMDLCCDTTPQPPVGSISRCKIYPNVTGNPYAGGPYFAMNKTWTIQGPTITHTLISLLIGTTQYASNQSITIDPLTQLQVAPGTDGNIYYTNITDWLNGIVPNSTNVVFRDDMNTIDAPTGTFYEVIIKLQDGLSIGYYKYSSLGFFLSDNPNNNWNNINGNLSAICTTL